MRIKILLACATFLAASYCGGQAASTPAKAPIQSASTSSRGTGKIDPKKEADIRRLMALTGAGAVSLQVMNNMETSMRPLLESSLPPGDYRAKLIDLFFKKFRAEATQDSIISLVIPIYDRYFSDEELKGLIAFYESPVGKKAVTVLPQVVTESQEAGGRWGQALGRKCMEEVLAEHPELKKQLEDAHQSSSN